MSDCIYSCFVNEQNLTGSVHNTPLIALWVSSALKSLATEAMYFSLCYLNLIDLSNYLFFYVEKFDFSFIHSDLPWCLFISWSWNYYACWVSVKAAMFNLDYPLYRFTIALVWIFLWPFSCILFQFPGH